ncbi:MAG: hypothetical protein GTO41_11505, partial [Burkholderiales bacterium]|nr:hypothetical protein [Burkholderiales bacterium]
LSGSIEFNQKQKTLWQRILDWVRTKLSRMGLDRYAPIKKMVSLNDTKEIFWNDERIQDLLWRSHDFVQNGKGFKWRAMGGSTQT